MAVKRYSQHLSPRRTPQSEPIPGEAQVANNAGGYVYQLDDWGRLDRFLVLGTEGGTYYQSERQITVQSAEAVLRCLAVDGKRAVARVAEVSEAGRAHKNDHAVFALALAAGHPQASPDARAAALTALPRVCRTGTHLFQFVEAVKEFRGWGRGLRDAVAAWYTSKAPGALALQLVKYRQRGGVSHRDLLRLSHPRATAPEHQALLRWAVGAGLGDRVVEDKRREKTRQYAALDPVLLPDRVAAFERLQAATSVAEIAKLIVDHRMPRECVPSAWLKSPAVWEALLQDMPATAMIRNLATMTRVGLLKPLSAAAKDVAGKLADEGWLRAARVHPIAVLAALCTYAQGHGERSDATWQPVTQVVDALDAAFYLTFHNVVPAGKRFLLACDVSGSMSGGSVSGVPGLTPCKASGALAMVTAATEPACEVVGFADQVRRLGVSPRMRLDEVARRMQLANFGSTDASAAMRWALGERLEVDCFVVLTDSETWAGDVHPSQALREYRRRTGVSAKLAVVGMTSTGFTIADPADAGMMDFVGFDSATPAAISEFAR